MNRLELKAHNVRKAYTLAYRYLRTGQITIPQYRVNVTSYRVEGNRIPLKIACDAMNSYQNR